MGAVLKNGKIVFEEDEVAPTTRKGKVAAGQTRTAAAEPGFLDNVADKAKGVVGTLAKEGRALAEGGSQGFGWGIRPRVEGAIAAAGELMPGKAFDTGAQGKSVLKAAGDAYNKQKAFSEQQNVAAQQDAPLTYGASEIGGAIATPLKYAAAPAAAALKVVPGGAKLLRGIKAVDEATKVNKTVRPVASAIVSGAKSGTAGGATAGAIGARDWTDVGDVASKTGSGALFGLGAGSVLGGLAIPAGDLVSSVGRNIGSRIGTIAGVARNKAGELVNDARKFGERFSDAASGTSANYAARRVNSKRINEEAQSEMFDALNMSGVTPKMADTSVGAAAAQGGNPIVADVSRATQGVLKGAYDKGVKGAKELAKRLDTRTTERGGRVRQFMANLAGLSPSTTVGAATRASKARAKGFATQDYDPATWSQPVVHSPELDTFLKKNKGLLQPIINEADEILKASEKVLPSFKKVNGVNVPTHALMDASMKRLKEKADSLIKSPDAANKQLGMAYKTKADALDNILKTQNPAYAKALERQATEFAKRDALKIGQHLSGKLFSNPVQTHDLMTDFMLKYPGNQKELREAMLSSLFDKSVSMRALPGKIAQHLDEKAEPEVKAIWNFMLRGPDNVDKLRKWGNVEHPLSETENVLRGGSVTNFAGTGKELLERGERSGNASVGRAGLGALMKNWAMLGSNAANALQRSLQGHNAAYRRAVQARLVKELGANTKPGELVAKAAVLKAARLTRQAARSQGIRRTARIAGRQAGGFTNPGADEQLYPDQ